MIGLQNNIKVTIIRNAAGSRSDSTEAGCRETAPTYYAAGRLSFKLPSACGANSQGLYDPALPHKVINIMNFFGAPSADFVPFNRSDLTEAVDLQCELQPGDEIVCIWKPLVDRLDPAILVRGLSTVVLPDKQGV